MTRIKAETMKELLKLYFIMGSTNSQRSPELVLKEAIDGGITLFQYREKGENCLTGEERLQLALKLKQIAHEHHISFIVNDDVDLALAIDADGVHIGQEDEPAEIVRQKIGSKILGVSAHNLEETRRAIEAGADYLGIGPIYKTKTKPDTVPVLGTNAIKDIREASIDIPLIGIGGITTENADKVISAGADGISVITAISEAESAADAARQLRSILERRKYLSI